MDDALERLPAVYAEFLVLQRRGEADAVIAERLGVPVESLPLLARLAAAKLVRVERELADRAAADDEPPPGSGLRGGQVGLAGPVDPGG